MMPSANKTDQPKAGETAGVKQEGTEILFWDLETAGVQGLRADRGFIVCVGLKWQGGKTRVLKISDYPGKHCQDDSNLLKAAYPEWCRAGFTVAHYGDKFDKRYFATRLLMAGLKPLPSTRSCDTWRIAKENLALSSNRMANVASALGCDIGKMDKGRGWPDWWMGAVRGDQESIDKMAVYCAQDVDCLEGIYNAMLPMIPNKYLLNRTIGLDHWACIACGGTKRQSRGVYYSEMKLWNRYQCRSKGCGKWSRSLKAIDGVRA